MAEQDCNVPGHPRFLPGPEEYVPIERDPIHYHTFQCKVCGEIVKVIP